MTDLRFRLHRRPAPRVAAGAFARGVQRFALLLALMPVGAALAADPCKPAAMDLCAWAKSREQTFLADIPSAEVQYAETGMAFTTVKADQGQVDFGVTLRGTARGPADAGLTPAEERAMLTAELHQRARQMACNVAARDFIANGGRIRNTYRLEDGKLLTIATIADCAESATTWSASNVDPCAPFGWDLCGLAKRYAATMAEMVAPPDQRFPSDDKDMALVDTRAEGATLVLESMYRRTRAEFEVDHPTASEREALATTLHGLVMQIDCKKPMLTFVAYGGTVRHVYRFRDGEAMADIRVAQCFPVDDPPHSGSNKR